MGFRILENPTRIPEHLQESPKILENPSKIREKPQEASRSLKKPQESTRIRQTSQRILKNRQESTRMLLRILENPLRILENLPESPRIPRNETHSVPTRSQRIPNSGQDSSEESPGRIPRKNPPEEYVRMKHVRAYLGGC